METGKAIVAVVEPKRFIASEAESVPSPDVEAVSAASVVMEKRPSEVEGVHGSGEPTRVASGSSSVAGRGRVGHVEDDDSGSYIDLEEVRTFLERATCVEIRTKGPNRHIVIPVSYSLLVDSEQATSSISPLCAEAKNRTLLTLKDANLHLGISGMALRVSFYFFTPKFIHFISVVLRWLTCFPLHVRLSSWRLSVTGERRR